MIASLNLIILFYFSLYLFQWFLSFIKANVGSFPFTVVIYVFFQSKLWKKEKY